MRMPVKEEDAEKKVSSSAKDDETFFFARLFKQVYARKETEDSKVRNTTSVR